MIRKCYLVMVALIISVSSRGEHANVQSSVVGESTGKLIRNGSGSVSLFSVGDPSIFGVNTWNVYAWNSTNSDSWIVNYAGYYVDTNLSMNTINYWGDGESPSFAPGYLGDPVSIDDHSFSAKRKGFPLGYYSIDVNGHDDWAYMLVDGVEVWNHEDCCDGHYDVWHGILNDSSTVEFRVMEFGGGSYGQISLNRQSISASAVSTFIPCHGGQATVTVTATGGVPPYTGVGTFTVNAGTYTYLVSDSLGDISDVEINVFEPAVPDSMISTNAGPVICQGDTVVLTAPSHGSKLSFVGGSQRAVIPFNSPETNYTYEVDFKTTEAYAGISSVRDQDLGGSFDRDLYLEEGEIHYRLYSEELISSTGENYSDGQWHHVAVVVEQGVGQKIYVDSILVASGTKDASDFNWDGILNIGFSNYWFVGEIDNVRMWNTVRTQSEIAQDQNLHVVGSLPGLIGNWNFDDVDGSSFINTVDNSPGYLMDGLTTIENNTNTYSWNTGETTRSITSLASGVFNVAVTNSNGCTLTTEVYSLIVNPIPATPIITANSPLSFCEGGSVTLTSNSVEGNQWSKDGMMIDPGDSSAYDAMESGAYIVTVTDSIGCSNSSTATLVDVVPSPSKPTIDAASATTFCEGGSVELSAHSEYVNRQWASSVNSFSTQWEEVEWGTIQALGKPNVYPLYDDNVYAWSPLTEDEENEFLELGYTYPMPINFIDIYETYGPGAVDTVYVKNPDTGDFEPVYTANAEYMGDTARILHITFPLTSYDVSEIRIHMNTLAVPDWNEIDAVSIGNDLPGNYLWSSGDSSASYTATTSSSYTVAITNSMGCSATSDPMIVIENMNPVVTSSPNLYVGACSTSYTLSSGQPGGGTYAGIGVTNTNFDPSIGVGVYSIQYSYEDANGCNGSANSLMTVMPTVQALLDSFPNVCSDASPITLTGGLPSGGVYIGTGVTNGTFDPSIGAGVYSITYQYTDSMGCSTSAMKDLRVDICSGIEMLKDPEALAVYPNPAKGNAVVYLNNGGKINQVEVFNSIGALVYSKAEGVGAGIDRSHIDLSRFTTGSYLIRVRSERGIFTRMLMVN